MGNSVCVFIVPNQEARGLRLVPPTESGMPETASFRLNQHVGRDKRDPPGAGRVPSKVKSMVVPDEAPTSFFLRVRVK